ncbi:hypothetical protein [Methylobacterium soli]|uniref:Uncharacterized protein n=1 Tax=Methylobacterium soli TaxID=553447 RepID=A0A6L3T8F7_9HYPH|nr:hypothetical protein [Methylobacterium soli]KAB1081881.1 hypothetical protein F6X53_01955 [Methylobacterium soli]GJE42702.1 hypothetical protein AEGHOMDF_1875 [Methylobacterium soli]
MGVGIASERRLLSEDEFERVKLSHYPDLGKLAPDETLALARWLRERRHRIRDIVAARRRARRGKAAASGIGAPEASERGLSEKKQVFARAIRRVNARLDQGRAERRRERIRTNFDAALGRKRAAIRHHPEPGETSVDGMPPIGSDRRTVTTERSEIGRVSQAVKDAQARRDS